MCGIGGLLTFEGKNLSCYEDNVSKLSKSLKSRGPDAKGEYVNHDLGIFFVHRRLSIIDLDDRSNQPLFSNCRKYCIVFNGEIYNYKDLRKKLISMGEVFSTNGDTEVVLKMFIKFGPDCLNLLRGMFAFAILNTDNKEVFLARDAYGIKPLYLAGMDDGWVFSSQVKAIVSSGMISSEIDQEFREYFTLLGSIPEPGTWYKNIQSVESGQYQILHPSSRKITKNKYCDISSLWINEKRNFKKINIQKYITEAVKESLENHLVADVPLGVFLSGGIDSSVILALMNEAGIKNIKAITVVYDEFKGTEADEEPLAKKISNKLDTELFIKKVTKDEFIKDLPKILRDMDQPSIDGINTWYASKAAKELGLKVVLSGIGGDELFYGYRSFYYLPRLINLTKIISLVPFLPSLIKFFLRSRAKKTDNNRWLSSLDWLMSAEGSWLLRRSVFSIYDLNQLYENKVELDIDRFSAKDFIKKFVKSISDSYFIALAQIESSMYLKNQLLRDADWASMSHGVEIRTPLVDKFLLEKIAPFATDLYKFKNKLLLTRVTQIPLPSEIVSKKKTGFGIPVMKWLYEEGLIRKPSSSKEFANFIMNSYE